MLELFFFVQTKGIALLVLTTIWSMYTLFRYMNYPVSDSASLLAHSRALKDYVFFEKFFVMDYGYRVQREEFDSRRWFYSYNLSLNLMRLFPESIRFRAYQFFNTALLVLFASLFGSMILYLAEAGGLSTHESWWLAVFFAMLFIGRTKFVMLAMGVYSELVNYVLFSCSLLSLLMLSTGGSVLWMLVFGGSLGLMMRNMQQYLLNLVGGVAALFAMDASWTGLALFFGAFFLTIADMLWVQFVKGESAFYYLESIVEVYLLGRHKKEGGQKTKGFGVSLLETAKAALNPWSSESFFIPIGGALYILPVSLAYLVWHGRFGALELYALLSGGLMLLTLALVKDDDGNRMTGRRMAYFGFIAFQVINASALILALSRHNGLLLAIFIVYFGAYILLQFYSVALNHFSDTVQANGLADQKKIVENYRIELAAFLKTVDRPAVVMGVLLAWGAPYRFYQWGEDMRAVELMAPVDDEGISGLIDRYGVTHITKTVIDFPLTEQCSLRDEALSPMLAKRLSLYSSTPNLTVWEVVA